MSSYEDFINGNYRPLLYLPEEEVSSPAHYDVFPDMEAIEIIARSMTEDQFYGYCFGNVLKYRLRVGKKDDVKKELSKADKYIDLYEEYKHCCIRNDNEILL